MLGNYARPLLLMMLTLGIWALLSFNIFFPIRLLAMLLVICVLPGYALVSVLFRRDTLDISDLAAFVVSFSLGITMLGGLVLNLLPFGLSAEGWRLWLCGFTIITLTISLLRVEAKSDDYAGTNRRPHRLKTPQIMIFTAAGVIFMMSLAIAYEGDRERPKDSFSSLWLIWRDEAQGAVELGVINLEGQATEYRLVLLSADAVVQEWRFHLDEVQEWTVLYIVPSTNMQSTELRAVLYKDESSNDYRTTRLVIGAR